MKTKPMPRVKAPAVSAVTARPTTPLPGRAKASVEARETAKSSVGLVPLDDLAGQTAPLRLPAGVDRARGELVVGDRAREGDRRGLGLEGIVREGPSCRLRRLIQRGARRSPPRRLVGSDRLGELFAGHAAACWTPSTMSSSSAIAAISRAAGPFQLIRLGVAPQSEASG
jgi:hypothetical protein